MIWEEDKDQFFEKLKMKEHYTDPDLLNELANYYSSFDTLSLEEIWDEIYVRYEDEDLANDVVAEVENMKVHYTEDSQHNKGRRYYNHLKERDYKEIYECRYAAKKLLDEGRVWGITAVKFGNIPVEIAQDRFFLKFDLPNNVYERIVEFPLFFKSKEEAEQYIRDQKLNKTCDSTQIVNETEFLRDVISGRLDRFISVAEKKDYARKHYLDDPIDNSIDLGSVRYFDNELGVPQYESMNGHEKVNSWKRSNILTRM